MGAIAPLAVVQFWDLIHGHRIDVGGKNKRYKAAKTYALVLQLIDVLLAFLLKAAVLKYSGQWPKLFWTVCITLLSGRPLASSVKSMQNI